MNTDAIANRAVGQYPVSVPTSLALESALGIHPEIIVAEPPILGFQELWVNAKTLYRNLLSSLEPVVARSAVPEELAITLEQEIQTIREIVRDFTRDQVQVVYYQSDYLGMADLYPHAKLRVDTTELQLHHRALQNETLDWFLLHHPEEVRVFPLKLEPVRYTRTLILTHCAYDLVSSKSFGELVLLESHTGRIKERAAWSTKYFDGKNLAQIPFREDLLQVFGDSEHFRPMTPSWRKAVLELAQRYHWSAVTTREKIRYGVEQLKDQELRQTLLEILVA